MGAAPRLALGALLASLAAAASEGDVRLAGGNTDAGRVEVYREGRWGWICADGANDEWQRSWGKPVAEVVCRQLGLRAAVGTMRMANGKADDVLAVVGASCNGTEASFSGCQLSLARGDAPRSACLEDATQPAAAAVRCTNFVPEEQPAVEVDETQAPLSAVIRDPYLRIACKDDPLLPRKGAEAEMPTFSCAVVQEPQQRGEAAESCAAVGAGGCGAEGGPPEGAIDAFVFQEAMREDLAAVRRRAAEAAAAGGYATPPGLRRSAVGLELENSTLDATELARVRRDYLSPLGRIILDLDASVTGLTGQKAGGKSAPAEAAAERVYEQLQGAGVAWLGDLGLPEEVHEEAAAALGDKVLGGQLAASSQALPSLERWLRGNSTLQAAIVAYFGGHAVLHGYKVVHLPATLSAKSFISAHWHHDRAGRRLKLFVLLNDVDPEEGHPTQVAEGSHRLTYYWQEEFQQSRYSDDYVRKSFRTSRLAGKRGSGYLFDTNTIHRGTPEGSQGRNVIVIEYHQAAKCGLVAKLGLNLPCPSGDQRPLNWYLGSGADA